MLTIIGGTYREICLHPRWDATFGSGVRAAAAVAATLAGGGVELHTWVTPSGRADLKAIAASFGFGHREQARFDDIEFQYDHALAPPRLYPDLRDITPAAAGVVSCERALFFGLIECDPKVHADVLVFDPQAGRRSRPPCAGGHRASRMAIVANLGEVAAMLASASTAGPEHRGASELGEALLRQERCEVVVVKNGVAGATVVTAEGAERVPSFETDQVFPIGSGDVFSGIFAAHWAEHGRDPVESARLASAATAYYCERRALPVPADLGIPPGTQASGAPPGRARRVYLAGPLFTLPQLWLLNEAKRCLEEQGLSVFSPKDEVGFLDDPDSARRVAEADLRGLESCDLVFAILDGLDPGTLFEVGYARKVGRPVVGFAERVDPGELTMLIGTGCRVYADYATAVYQAGWRAASL
jgi:hypothetical protein